MWHLINKRSFFIKLTHYLMGNVWTALINYLFCCQEIRKEKIRVFDFDPWPLFLKKFLRGVWEFGLFAKGGLNIFFYVITWGRPTFTFIFLCDKNIKMLKQDVIIITGCRLVIIILTRLLLTLFFIFRNFYIVWFIPF